MRVNTVAAVIFAAACAGCAQIPQEQPLAHTASGRPEAIFDNQSPADVSAKVAGQCMDGGFIILNQDAGNVVCQKTLGLADAIAYKLMLGNAYSTNPVVTVRVSSIQIGPNTRAQASTTVSTQMPFGQINSMELNDPTNFNKVEQMFYSIGGHN